MVRFYTSEALEIIDPPPLPSGYSLEVWRPRRDGLNLKGLPYKQFAVWWLFDRLGIFANPFAGVVMIKDGRRIVHHSLVTPKWYRFPDMRQNDLQIGNVWTAKDQRGYGLAKIAINEIHRLWGLPCIKFWYLVSDDNHASIRLIESFGYKLTALGIRTKFYNFLALGRFRITKFITD